jgi:hypothetical protein
MGQVVMFEYKGKGTRVYKLEMDKQYDSKRDFLDTLAHEMIHLYQFTQVNDNGAHNKLFYSFKPKLKYVGLKLSKTQTDIMNEVKTKKFKDPYLKPLVLEAVKKVEEFAWFKNKGEQAIYYEGNFQEDVLNNFSQKESERIFTTMSRYLNDNRLLFLQKKVKVVVKETELTELQSPKNYYEYIVSKR